MNPSLANILGDCAALLGVDSTADDVTDREALLVLGDLQLGVTCLVRDLLTVHVWDGQTLLRGDGGAGAGLHCSAHLLHCSAALLLLYDLHLGLALGDLHHRADLLLPHPTRYVGHVEALLLFVWRALGLVDGETDVLVAVAALGLVGALTDLLVLHPAVSACPSLVVLRTRHCQPQGQHGDQKYPCEVTATHTAARAVYVLGKCNVLMATETVAGTIPSYIVQNILQVRYQLSRKIG